MHKAMSTEIDTPDGVSSVDAKFVFVDGDRQPDHVANPVHETFEEEADETEKGVALVNSLHATMFGEDVTTGEDRSDVELKAAWLGLLHPSTTVRHLYDSVQMSILLYFLFILPYRLGFSIEPKGGEVVLDFVIDLLLMLDIFVSMNAYYFDRSTGLMVTDPKRIRSQYMKSWFVVDLLAVFPFDQFFRIISLVSNDAEVEATLAYVANEVRVLKMTRMLRLGRLKELINPAKLSQMVASLLEPLGLHGVELTAMFYMRINVLVFVLLAVVHILACWWGKVGTDGLQNNTGWIYRRFHDGKELGHDESALTNLEKYYSSMYFVLVSMSSTGYGDIAAASPKEEFTSSMIILIGVFMLAYIVGTFGMMIANIANEANAFDSKMRAVNTMLNQTNCTAEVKMRVMDFYSRKSPSHMFYDVYCELPGAVRRELMKARYKDIMHRIPFLRGLEDLVLVKVCSTVNEYSIMKGDIVCRGGDARQDLILINTGIVTILPPDPNADEGADGEDEIKLLGPVDTHGREHDIPGEDRIAGSYFGVDEFIGLRKTQSVTLMAKIYTEVSVLSRNRLTNVFIDHPELKQRLDTYAQTQRDISMMFADGELDHDEVERLQTMKDTLAEDNARQAEAVSKKREGYGEGEVSMINVLRKDNQEEKRHLHLEERLARIEESMAEIAQHFKNLKT